MIKLKSLIREENKKISLQSAMDQKMFGPVYHGTTSDKQAVIDKEGFKLFIGNERSGDISHGYEISPYSHGMPAPVHHLGFGIYFTTSKSIFKQFNQGTAAGMRTYFLNVPQLETINWGSPNTMMKWWIANGYDYKVTPPTTFGNEQTNLAAIRIERLRATNNLTDVLKSKYDAVWYKGQGMYRLLDGDQICVYNPDNIYQIDKSLIKSGEIGSMVKAKVGIDPYGREEITIPIGTKGIILKKTSTKDFFERYPLAKWAEGSDYLYDIKWKKGGTMHQVLDKWIELI